MKSALMVAEKPSLAASLAKILSNGRHTTRKGKKKAHNCVDFLLLCCLCCVYSNFLGKTLQDPIMYVRYMSGKEISKEKDVILK